MAGPLTIQRVATGLADLLGLRATGQLPANLAETVAATVDIWPLYGLDRQAAKTGTSAAIGAVGTIFPSVGAPTTVPAGEIWDVLGITISKNGGGVLGAGTTYKIAPMISRNGLTNTTELLSPIVSFTTGENPIVTATFRAGSLIARPTDFLGGICVGGTFGVPTAFDIGVTVIPYRI